MDAKEKSAFIQKNLGEPQKIAEGLRRFRKSAMVLSKQRPRMIQEHPQEWVALFDGEVRASNKSFENLMGEIDRQEIPRGEVLVRFIDSSERIMIL